MNTEKSSLIDFLDSIAYLYDYICQPCTQERIEFLSDIIKRFPEDSLFIDQACSTGETLLKISTCQINLSGMDLSSGMIHVAKAKADRNQVHIDFTTGDMRSFCPPKETYDIIYNNSIVWLNSFEDLCMTIEVAWNAIKRGGVLVFDFNNPFTFLQTDAPFFAACVDSEIGEIYKTSFFHNEPKTYTATQIYTHFNREEQCLRSFAGVITWNLFLLDDVTGQLSKQGFQIELITGDYNKSSVNKCMHIQVVAKKPIFL